MQKLNIEPVGPEVFENYRRITEEAEAFRGVDRDLLQKERVNEIGAFMKEHGLPLIAIRGWTPSFNDGDPCTHSQDCVILDPKDPALPEDEDDFAEFVAELICEEYPDRVLKHRDPLVQVIRGMEEALETAFETGWKLTFVLRNGEVFYEHDYYDCGY